MDDIIINWPLFHEQKAMLIAMADNTKRSRRSVELLDGLIALMDTLQDTLEVPKEATVTEAMNKAGNDIAAELMTASVAKSMNGLGGSPTYEEWLNKEVANRDLCIAYSKSEIDSVTAIYLAMVRAKTL